MKAKTVLFFPWHIGAGHTGRCLVVAHILRRLGYKCFFSNDPTGRLVTSEGFEVISRETTVFERPPPSKTQYLSLPNIDAVYASMRYYRAERIEVQLLLDLTAVDLVKPRFIVSHMQPTSVIAARIRGLPAVSIADADFIDPSPEAWMPWVTGYEANFAPYPRSTPAFNTILRKNRLEEIADVSDLLCSDLVLLASIPELEPIPPIRSKRNNIVYVGPLIWDHSDHELKSRLNYNAPRPRVYASFGSGEGTAVAATQVAIDAATQSRCSLVLSTGYAAKAPLPQTLPNVAIHRFGGLNIGLQWADLMVCHGGHSTLIAGLCAGKPIIVIPTMSENEANGRFMVEKTGAGFLLYRTEIDVVSHRLNFVPRYIDESSQPSLTTESFLAAIADVTTSRAYSDASQGIAQRLRPWLDRTEHLVANLLAEV